MCIKFYNWVSITIITIQLNIKTLLLPLGLYPPRSITNFKEYNITWDFKLSNNSVAPASSFYEDIKARQQEIFLEKMISMNDGDPFKDDALFDLNEQINNQDKIIEANQ